MKRNQERMAGLKHACQSEKSKAFLNDVSPSAKNFYLVLGSLADSPKLTANIYNCPKGLFYIVGLLPLRRIAVASRSIQNRVSIILTGNSVRFARLIYISLRLTLRGICEASSLFVGASGFRLSNPDGLHAANRGAKLASQLLPSSASKKLKTYLVDQPRQFKNMGGKSFFKPGQMKANKKTSFLSSVIFQLPRLKVDHLFNYLRYCFRLPFTSFGFRLSSPDGLHAENFEYSHISAKGNSMLVVSLAVL